MLFGENVEQCFVVALRLSVLHALIAIHDPVDADRESTSFFENVQTRAE